MYHSISPVSRTKWVVYAKQPFASPKTVVEYLGRNMHKIAISNHRFIDVNKDKVTFHYKDHCDAAMKKQITVDGLEFLRRFALHILTHGYMRIRHYGFWPLKTSPRNSIPQRKTSINPNGGRSNIPGYRSLKISSNITQNYARTVNQKVCSS